MDYLEVIRRESARFAEMAEVIDVTATVPSCPDWSGADLVHHLVEVQTFWSAVARGADGPDVPDRPRPADADLPAAVRDATGQLLGALRGQDPAAPCWSWHDVHKTIGFVLRRQAHEALIRRVDAEQTAGVDVTPAGTGLAVDGVDELLRVHVHGVPSWGTFTPSGSAVRLAVTEPPGAAWTMSLGRFTGVGPDSGTAWDLPAAELVPDAPPAAELLAPAWELDLWLWGRGPQPGEATGEPAVLEELRATIADATR